MSPHTGSRPRERHSLEPQLQTPRGSPTSCPPIASLSLSEPGVREPGGEAGLQRHGTRGPPPHSEKLKSSAGARSSHSDRAACRRSLPQWRPGTRVPVLWPSWATGAATELPDWG